MSGMAGLAGGVARGAALKPGLVLLGGAFFCYGGEEIVRLGFYHDDWTLLSYLHFAPPGFWPRVSALTEMATSLHFRPIHSSLLTLSYMAFGLNPLPWQMMMLSINVGLCVLVYRLIRVFGGSLAGALLGSLVFLAFPNKDATLFWPAIMVNSLSLGLFLAAYLAHLEFVATGRRRWLWISGAALAAALAAYEQVVFLTAFWLLTPGPLPKEAAGRLRRGLGVAAGVTGLYFLYKFVVVPHFIGVRFNKTIVLSLRHFVDVYINGVRSTLSPRFVSYVLDCAADAFRSAPGMASAALLWPLIVLAGGRLPEGSARSRLLVLGAGIFFLGYLPIALSDYSPSPFNHMNRINQVPMLGVVLSGVWLLERLSRRAPLALPAACLGAGVLLAAHMEFAAAWRESYRRQLELRSVVQENLASWPSGKQLLVLIPDHYIRGKAPVFTAHWDTSGAMRIWTGDPSREADVVDEGFDFRPDGIRTHTGFFPYDHFRLLDARGKRLVAVQPGDFSRRP